MLFDEKVEWCYSRVVLTSVNTVLPLKNGIPFTYLFQTLRMKLAKDFTKIKMIHPNSKMVQLTYGPFKHINSRFCKPFINILQLIKSPTLSI